jgi:hypothetical protein
MHTSRLAGLGLVVSLGLTTACGAGAAAHTDGIRPAGFDGPGIAAGNRHADAVAEAKRLIRLSPTIGAESRAAKAPKRSLRTAPDRPFGNTVVSRRRFWTSDRSLTATFDALKKLAPHGTEAAGEGESSDHGRITERDAEFDVVHLPGTLFEAELEIEVVPAGHGHSAVGAYAEVVPQPKRRADENVPRSLRTVQVAKVSLSDDSVKAQKTVTGHRAARLVRDFDVLRVEPPQGVHPCPMQLTALRATFRAGGHVWQAEDSVCGEVLVTRDGHRLPALAPDRAFTRSLHRDLG